jgi:(p)ppGpp synthase/HD superfamily hydrolase
MESPVQLTPRFTQAVDYARQIHVSLRRGTEVPYMAHLLGVASLRSSDLTLALRLGGIPSSILFGL